MDRANTPLSAIGQFNFASEFMSYFELFASAVNSAISPMFMEELKRGNILASHRIFKQSLVFFFYRCMRIYYMVARDLSSNGTE